MGNPLCARECFPMPLVFCVMRSFRHLRDRTLRAGQTSQDLHGRGVSCKAMQAGVSRLDAGGLKSGSRGSVRASPTDSANSKHIAHAASKAVVAPKTMYHALYKERHLRGYIEKEMGPVEKLDVIMWIYRARAYTPTQAGRRQELLLLRRPSGIS